MLDCKTTSAEFALETSDDNAVFKEPSAEIALDSSALTSATRSETSVDNATFKDDSDDCALDTSIDKLEVNVLSAAIRA
jgi:hypothetical protein